MLTAPRILNEPVRWRFSAFSWTRPAREPRERLGRVDRRHAGDAVEAVARRLDVSERRGALAVAQSRTPSRGSHAPPRAGRARAPAPRRAAAAARGRPRPSPAGAPSRGSTRRANTSPARFLRRRSSSRPSDSRKAAVLLELLPELGHVLAAQRLGEHDRRLPLALAVEREDRAHLVQHRLRGGVIHLVDRDHVGDLHDPRFQRLHRVAGAGHQHEQHRVGDPDHLDLALPGADRLEQDELLARPRRAGAPPAASPRRGRRGGRACPSSG